MKGRALLVVAIIGILLCSCGPSEQQTNESGQVSKEAEAEVNNVTEWVVSQEIVLPEGDAFERKVVPDDGWIAEYLCTLSGENIYRYVSTCVRTEEGDAYDTAYYLQKMMPPYEDWEVVDSITLEDWVEGDSCTIWGYPWASVMTREGQLFTVLQGKEETYLGQWTQEDGHSVQKVETDFVQLGEEDANSIEYMYVNGVQDIFLTDSKGLLRGGINQEFSRIPLGKGSVLQIVENPFQQQLYLAGNMATGGFYLQTMEGEQPLLSSDTVFMESSDFIIWSSETTGYLCNNREIWEFSFDKQEINKIMELSYQGSTLDRLMGAEVGEGGSVCLLVEAKNKYLLMKISEGTGKDEKIRLELATGQATESLKQAVVQFNQSNKEYYVEIREQGEGVEWADYRTQIQAELSTGKGPDLLTNDLFINYQVKSTAEKKLLLELTEYFEEEGEDILPNVWDCGKVEEHVYAIPYSYMIQTLVTNKSMVGERSSWTVEELMQCVRETDVQQFSSAFDGASVFWYLSREGGIIDWENGICYFDSERAKELLQFAEEYGGEIDYLKSDIKVLEREALVSYTFIWGPSVFNQYASMFENGQVYIGYPTANGESGHVMVPDMVGISQNTKHVEGTVAFLKYLISDNMQEYLAECLGSTSTSYVTGLPVHKEALEHLYEYLLNVPSEEEGDIGSIAYEYPTEIWVGEGEYIFVPSLFTEDSVEQMRNVIETAMPRPAGEEEVFDMVSEETKGYFGGNKDADEVLAILQNRVQLYFDEMK